MCYIIPPNMKNPCDIAIDHEHELRTSRDNVALYTDSELIRHTETSSVYKIRCIKHDGYKIMQIYNINKIIGFDIIDGLTENDGIKSVFAYSILYNLEWFRKCRLEYISPDRIANNIYITALGVDVHDQMEKLYTNRMIDSHGKYNINKINEYVESEISSYQKWKPIINASGVLFMPDIINYGLLHFCDKLLGYYTIFDQSVITEDLTDSSAIFTNIKKLHTFLLDKQI